MVGLARFSLEGEELEDLGEPGRAAAGQKYK